MLIKYYKIINYSCSHLPISKNLTLCSPAAESISRASWIKRVTPSVIAASGIPCRSQEKKRKKEWKIERMKDRKKGRKEERKIERMKDRKNERKEER